MTPILKLRGVNLPTSALLPAQPTGLTATAVSSTEIDLAWTDNATNETGYRVERSLDGSTGWTTVETLPADSNSGSNSGLTADTEYFYRVFAFNGAGDSTASNVDSATTEEAYDPGVMTFGSTGEYVASNLVTSGNAETLILTFKKASFTGSEAYIARVDSEGAVIRMTAILYPSDYATVELRNKLRVAAQDVTYSLIFDLISIDDLNDGDMHSLFVSYNGTAGTAVFYVDGVDADDTGYSGRVLGTGTLRSSGIGGRMAFGSGYGGLYFDGEIGFAGSTPSYLTNYSDFFDGANPKELEQSTWTEWGSRPFYFNEYGEMDDNKGSRADLTKNGTITGPS